MRIGCAAGQLRRASVFVKFRKYQTTKGASTQPRCAMKSLFHERTIYRAKGRSRILLARDSVGLIYGLAMEEEVAGTFAAEPVVGALAGFACCDGGCGGRGALTPAISEPRPSF
jgi:hypothetical protein